MECAVAQRPPSHGRSVARSNRAAMHERARPGSTRRQKRQADLDRRFEELLNHLRNQLLTDRHRPGKGESVEIKGQAVMAKADGNSDIAGRKQENESGGAQRQPGQMCRPIAETVKRTNLQAVLENGRAEDLHPGSHLLHPDAQNRVGSRSIQQDWAHATSSHADNAALQLSEVIAKPARRRTGKRGLPQCR